MQPGLFAPAHSQFWETIRRIRPDLYKDTHTRDRVPSAPDLHALFTAAGIEDVSIVPEDYALPGSDWWTIMLGTGYRGTLDQLTPEERELVHRQAEDAAAELRASVLYATASKP
jgi:hypothetical protein